MQKKCPINRFDLVLRAAGIDCILNTRGVVKGCVCLTTSRPFELKSLLIGLCITHHSEEINENKTRLGKQQYFETARTLFGDTGPEVSQRVQVLEGGDYRFNFALKIEEDFQKPATVAKGNAMFLWSSIKACLIDKKGKSSFANIKIESNEKRNSERNSLTHYSVSSLGHYPNAADEKSRILNNKKEQETVGNLQDGNRNRKEIKSSDSEINKDETTQHDKTDELSLKVIETEKTNGKENQLKQNYLSNTPTTDCQCDESILDNTDNTPLLPDNAKESEIVNIQVVTAVNKNGQSRNLRNSNYRDGEILEKDTRDPRIILSKDKNIVMKAILQKNFFCPGSTVSFMIQCENNSKKAFKMMYACLIEESHKTPTCWASAKIGGGKSNQRVVAAVVGPPVSQKEVVVWESEVIPAVAAKPESWYTLRIELKSTVMSHLHMEIPVVIMPDPTDPASP